jgi:putative flippase GtrA
MNLIYKTLNFFPIQLRKFIVVGIFTVLIDFSIYQLILFYDLTSISYAKGISFITGTIFSYSVNKTWTFLHKSDYLRSSLKFIALYMTTLFLNININLLCLDALGNFEYAIYISFIVATGSSALCNFLGMKIIVFKRRA